MAGSKKILDAYIRVSQVAGREGESFQSPLQQRDAIIDALHRNGYELGEVNDADLDQSGGTVDRPGFQRVLERIERGEIDGIAVIRANRFARSVAVAGECVERIQAVGGVFLSATEHVDLLSAAGKFSFNMLMAQAQYERDMAIESWRLARRNAVARGAFIGPTPVGYTRDLDALGRAHGALRPHPVEAPVIREVFRRRADGAPHSELARYMDAHIPARKGDKWPIATVRDVLTRRVYRGEVHHGDLVNTEAHEPLVTEIEWRAAQRAKGVRRPRTDDWLLSGLLRCAGCRYGLRPHSSRHNGVRYRAYRCTATYHSSGRCETPARIQADEVERFVVAAMFARHERVLEGRSKDADRATEATLREAEDALAELARIAAESLRPDLYASALRDAERRVAEASAAHAHAQVTMLGPSGVPSFYSLTEVWPDLAPDEQRHAIAGLIDCAFVRGRSGRGQSPVAERVLPVWRGLEPADLPRRGVVVPPRPIDWHELQMRIAAAEMADQHAI